MYNTYNVTDIRKFGASPIGDTDCSEAIKKALNDLNEGGILYFPPGIYLVENPIKISNSHITIAGDGKQSKIIYTYEQTEEDDGISASLFSFENNISDVKVKDMYVEYRGEFFDEPQKSYNGKISAFCFGICFDVIFTNVEITRFNASGIGFMGSPDVYSKRLKVDKCYIHHNRVAGILYGYVDGISITNNTLEYHGSKHDGGTGYGCAGSAGGIPVNVQIIGNKVSFNYRKGIDLHAGKKVIIQGNICEGNVLSGIYAEGRNSNNFIINGNMITNMILEDTPYLPIYGAIEGIGFGVYSGIINEHEERNFTLCENEISGFSFENGIALPLYSYYGIHSGTVQIKNNVVNAGKIAYAIAFNTSVPHTEKCKTDISITGNHIKCRECTHGVLSLHNFDNLDFSHNRISIKKANYPFIITNGSDSGAIFASFNNITYSSLGEETENKKKHFSDMEKLFFEFGKDAPYDYPKIIKDNILNGKIIN